MTASDISCGQKRLVSYVPRDLLFLSAHCTRFTSFDEELCFGATTQCAQAQRSASELPGDFFISLRLSFGETPGCNVSRDQMRKKISLSLETNWRLFCDAFTQAYFRLFFVALTFLLSADVFIQ